MAAGFALVPAARAFAADKLGVVDVQRVLDTVDEGRKAKADFQKEIDSKKTELARKQQEVKKAEESFEKQKLILSPSAVEDKRKDLENKRTELQKFMMNLQADMQKREMQLSGDILKKIRSVIEKVGRDGGYDIVWEKIEGGIVYAKPAFDLTDQVIVKYDKAYKK